MRLLTTLLVAALLIVAGIAYGNGSTTTESTTGTEVTTPTGTGPTTGTTGTEATTGTTTTGTEATTGTTTTGTETTTTTTTTETTNVMTMASPEVETFNTNLVATNFGVDRASIAQLRQAGWSWGDINMMAQISQKTGQPISQIASLRSQGMSYTDIANRFNLTAMDITVPSPAVTRVAGSVTEYGYQPIYYLNDQWGNPVLTRYDAERLSKLGYSWKDIAVAANISAKTGVPVSQVLSWTDRGYTWPQVAREYGLDPEKVMDVSKYPFAPAGTMMGPSGAVGAGPMQPVVIQTVPPPTGAGPGMNGNY